MQSLRPLIHRTHALYFEDSKAPTALLLTNRIINEEATACVNSFRKQSAAVICSAKPILHTRATNRVLAMALRYDSCHLDRLKCGFIVDELDVFTRTRQPIASKSYFRTFTRTPISLFLTPSPLVTLNFMSSFLSIMKTR